MSNVYAAPEHFAPPNKKSNSPLLIIIVLGVLLVVFVMCAGIMAGLLLPAIGSAREAARRMQCANHLKQIALAMHNYADANGAFPPAYTEDASGNKLHSWRTLILPYMEQVALYNTIDLSKPWNDPINAHAMSVDLPFYRCPSSPNLAPGMTTYRVPLAANGIFSGPDTTSLPTITDGLANTLLVLEVDASQAVHWMEPNEIAPAAILQMIQNTTPNSSPHTGGRNTVFADGSVRFVLNNTDPAFWNGAFSKGGGEVMMAY